MAHAGITKDGLYKSKLNPCLMCSYSAKGNSVLCAQCGKWIQYGCAGAKVTTPIEVTGIVEAENGIVEEVTGIVEAVNGIVESVKGIIMVIFKCYFSGEHIGLSIKTTTV